MSSVEELRLDLEELRRLESEATRPKVKDRLTIEVRKLQTLMVTLQQQQEPSSAETASPATPQAVTVVPRARHTTNITTYAWDQSEKFMKIYVTLNGVQKLPKDNITSEFFDKAFKVKVTDLEGKDYSVHVANLSESIIPSESFIKMKTDTVLVMLKKRAQGKTWPYVTEREKKRSEEKAPKVDEAKDPSDGIMDMLKKMYNEGDDEMKRTIAKSWTQSQSRKSGEMPDNLLYCCRL